MLQKIQQLDLFCDVVKERQMEKRMQKKVTIASASSTKGTGVCRM